MRIKYANGLVAVKNMYKMYRFSSCLPLSLVDVKSSHEHLGKQF